MTSKKIAALLGAVGVGVVIAGTSLIIRHNDSAAVMATPGGSASATSPSTRVQSAPSLSPESITALKRGGTTLEGVTGLDASQLGVAEQVGRASLGSNMIDSGSVIEAGTARVTIADYGRETSTEPTVTSKIDPAVVDRAATVLVYDHVSVPLFGPYRPGVETADDQQTYDARLVVIVDAATGEFLSAETL